VNRGERPNVSTNVSGRTGAGAILVACACLALAACGATHHPSGSTQQPSNSTQPPPSSTPQPPTQTASTSGPTPAARYLTIAEAGNRALDEAFDDGLEGEDANNLAAAQADLRSAAATERLFDQRLAAIAFPPAIKRTADALIAVNEARADLTARLASVGTLAALHQAETQLDAANEPVEAQVKAIRAQLGLPPPPP
jgi:hypothetical protein